VFATAYGLSVTKPATALHFGFEKLTLGEWPQDLQLRRSIMLGYAYTRIFINDMQPQNSFIRPIRAFGKFGLKSLIVGIGIGLVVVAYITYTSRPVPINKEAVTATFDYVYTDDAGHLQFEYILKNNTNQDYEVYSQDSLKTYANLARQGSLQPSNGYVTFDTPLFIPSHNSVELTVSFAKGSYTYDSPYKLLADAPGADKKDVEAYRRDVASYVTSHLRNLGGFTIIDPDKRYEIDFPPGWTQS
jgi:hypothetical protein